jgi:outer membrane protein
VTNEPMRLRYSLPTVLLLLMTALPGHAQLPAPGLYAKHSITGTHQGGEKRFFTSVKEPSQLKQLTLRDAILLALRNNPQIQSARLQRVVDKFSLEVARNEFWPHYGLSGSATYAQGETPQYRGSPEISLKTALGTQIVVTGQPALNNNEGHSISVTATQPLLRGFGPAVNLAGYRNSKDNEEANKLSLKDRFQSIATEVITAYHQVVQDYNRLDVDQSSLNESEQTLHATHLQINAGKRPETDITQQDAQVAQQRFAITQDRNTIDQDTQKLLILLGLNPNAKITIDKKIDLSLQALPSKENSVQIAMCNNINYRKSLLTLKTKYRDLDVAKNDQLWNLSVTATNAQNILTRYQDFQTDRRVVLNLDIPLDDKPRQQTLVNAKTGLEQFKIDQKNTERQLVSDVITALRNLSAQREQITLAEKSVEYSEQSLHIAQKKFQYGRSSMFEVTSLQRQLTSQQQTLINQKITYLNTMAQFEQTLGTSLKRWGVDIIY